MEIIKIIIFKMGKYNKMIIMVLQIIIFLYFMINIIINMNKIIKITNIYWDLKVNYLRDFIKINKYIYMKIL